MLDQSEYIRLERDPHQLGRELELLDPESWVVIDEVQKVPTLLDEVHRLIEKRGLRFVLCGSSARKLKRSGVNLLAGRAELVRTTVQNYFEILVDTLLGYWLQPWKLKPGNKQVAHPKFYLFDSGVARALSGRVAYAPTPEECGPLLETLVGNEIRAYLERHHPGWRMSFWRTHDDVEVDILVETDWGYAAVEVKASSTWRNQYGLGLRRLREELAPRGVRSFGVFRGPQPAKFGELEVLPVGEFLSRLWSGRVI